MTIQVINKPLDRNLLKSKNEILVNEMWGKNQLDNNVPEPPTHMTMNRNVRDMPIGQQPTGTSNKYNSIVKQGKMSFSKQLTGTFNKNDFAQNMQKDIFKVNQT